MKYELEAKDDGVVALIYGALSERSDEGLKKLDAALGKKPVTFDLEGLMRVNAAGEALWAQFLRKLGRRAGYAFRNCSVDFIEAVGRNAELVRGGKIVSLHAPLKCRRCGHAATVVLDTAGLSPNASFGAPPCGKCGRAMEAEVPPAAYLGFLYGD